MINKYCSLSEIENMMPWERDIYLSLINNYIEQINKEKLDNNYNG